jgi:hypothetical protein
MIAHRFSNGCVCSGRFSSEQWAGEAEALFRKDLQHYPRNPRGLIGLWQSLVRQHTADSAGGYTKSVLSARLRSVRPGRQGLEAVTLRHPVMPVANGLGRGLVGIKGDQL